MTDATDLDRLGSPARPAGPADRRAWAEGGCDADLDLAARAIAGARSVALACHVSPDGDALGSMLALHHLCRTNGKPSVASWSEPFVVAPHYAFLPGVEATKPADFPRHPELMVTLDCSTVERLGDLAPIAREAAVDGRLVVLDHHVSNSRFGSVNVVDETAAATAVVVRRLASRLGWQLDRDVAVCLYAGLVTDTGRFSHANTTPEVFELAHELTGYDLPLAAITRQLFDQHRFAYLQLEAACISGATLDRSLGLVSATITTSDLVRFGVEIEETEAVIDLVRKTAEADVACVLKEAPEGVRVSLRSTSDVDVGEIAGRLGGGGHRYAAGFSSAAGVDEVLGSVRQALAAQRSGRDDEGTDGRSRGR